MLIRQDLLLICLDTILLLCALGLLIPSLVLFIECVSALFGQPAEVTDPEYSERPKLAVLVPAHNEASCIRATLDTVTPQLQATDRLVVVADNCRDDTATIARTAGATVIERTDPERRGKGYALDYGLQFIEADPPEVVVLIDADCRVEPAAIRRITRRAIATGRPTQAVYLMEKPENPGPKDAVSAFAFKVKNLVRPLGLTQWGLPCLLTGTGMAFPWSVIRSVDLASGHIVEDMKLGLDLAFAGYSPTLCSTAQVVGCLPQQQQASESQRTRWEHGHLQMLLTYAPILCKTAVQQRRCDLLVMALELAVPPLSLLATLWLGMIGVTLLAASYLGAFWLPAIVLAIAGMFLITAILMAWLRFGQADLSMLTLLTVPLYIFWKIPLYLRFLIQPQRLWIRTNREPISPSETR